MDSIGGLDEPLALNTPQHVISINLIHLWCRDNGFEITITIDAAHPRYRALIVGIPDNMTHHAS
jgi:hypothetical protein